MQHCNYVLKIINYSSVLTTEHQVSDPAVFNSPMNSCLVERTQSTIQNNSYIWRLNVRNFYWQKNIMGQLSILSSQPRHLERAESFSKPQKRPSLLRRTFSLKSVRREPKKRVKFSGVTRECCCMLDQPPQSHSQNRR